MSSATQKPQPILTPRQAEILLWCATGKTSWEIAKILEISESTVQFHVYESARRLGVVGRTAACVRATELGLLG
jgi:DNA-binding CsgD family transcriptional regulator